MVESMCSVTEGSRVGNQAGEQNRDGRRNTLPCPKHLERTKTLCTSMILATIVSIEKDRSNT